MMQRIVAIPIITIIIISCAFFQPLPSQESLIQTGVAQTTNAIVILPFPEIKTSIPSITPDTLREANPTENLALPPTSSLNGTAITTPIPEVGTEARCGDSFLAKITYPPELVKDLFEHHAHGLFLIILLEMSNITDQPIQIWDGDYTLDATLANSPVFYTPQKAATGYLFIVRGNNLHQDLIKPGEHWKTYLAFDIDPRSKDWVLVVKPGNEIGNQLCELRIRLNS